MTNAELARNAARMQLRYLGEAMTYHGPEGNIAVNVLLERNVQSIGPNGSLNEFSYVASFSSDDIDDPRRGEILSDSVGNRWRLDRELPVTDFYVSQWAVSKA